MCGINGFIKKSDPGNTELKAQINTMNDLIFHRGPDDDGVFCKTTGNYALAMGMRRLSIIDLSTGKQPISNDSGTITIVFNGEIYNYQVLRNELQSKGVTFKTKSDTEVILKLYELEGESSFKKLDGMFAFSIHDNERGKVFIARDFFGEKPLYYSKSDNQFIWASELKSLVPYLEEKPKISATGVNLFFRLTYIPPPFTIYENVHKLEANHYIEYDLGTHTYSTHQIEPDKLSQKSSIDFNTAKNTTKELVKESVGSRSISDVPLGTFLSGGVDSSIISLCLAQCKEEKINTFSIGFEKKSFDETDKSRVVSKLINSNHNEFIIGENDLKDSIHEIIINFDEPFSDTAALPTHLVSKKTRERVTVALTGDGGDEMFGGYNKYYIGKLNRRYTRLVPKGIHSAFMGIGSKLLKSNNDQRGLKFKINKLLNSIDYNGQFYWDIISLANTSEQAKKLLLNEIHDSNIFKSYMDRHNIQNPRSVHDFRYVDKFLSLDGGMLAKVDRTSMQNSLECRAPFLNKEIWHFANSLPEEYLMKGWSKKHILKEAFKDEFPENFLERGKQGFGSPVGDWLRSNLKKELLSYIEPDFLARQGLFNIDYVNTLVNDHITGKKDSTYSVWAYYCFQKWYKNIYQQL
ncbi:asparagine synthase (glutamine-hydrolyzing) [Flagellimonas alvinocaridis]|uniref:asparagine synthase (glutamine-hydrolyzing) n=1 Tax=Flagellimonas alvinocaridis TaxID=2530200 RepID=A0A4S8RVU5_9FLAO|nr:asparagine synthase (glutamine-hydrolyzing) [Allomuricauda alvinocaridis]THV58104.1 asparagine synthase (glutamine-hydrolyzing) [Allomuricauda alvinocaridis]